MDREKRLIHSYPSIELSYLFGGFLMFFAIFLTILALASGDMSSIIIAITLFIVAITLFFYGVIRSGILRESLFRFKTIEGRINYMRKLGSERRGYYYWIKFHYIVDGITYVKIERVNNFQGLHGFVGGKELVMYDPLKPKRAILAKKRITGYDPEKEREELDQSLKIEEDKEKGR